MKLFWSPLRRFILLSPIAAESLSLRMSSSTTSSSSNNNIAVFGCGVLGTSLCRQILQSSKRDDDDRKVVTGVTKSTSRHDEIYSEVLGSAKDDGRLSLATSDEILSGGRKFRDVVFCAPPSGFDDYPAAVRECMDSVWDKDAGGVFVFTSSGSVYGEGETGSSSSPPTVTESTPTADPSTSSPRIARLVNAEEACVKNDGTVLRLAGLYTYHRGAHNYWLKSPKKGEGFPGRGDRVINLLHYDDAAGACLRAVLTGSGIRGRTFLIGDGVPTTRLGICESAVKSRDYREDALPVFKGGEEDSVGKIYGGSLSNEALGWKPMFPSFDEFMKSQA